MKLYYHKTDGGAEYLTDKFIRGKNGHKEGIFKGAKYIVRIDGDITKDAELTVVEQKVTDSKDGLHTQKYTAEEPQFCGQELFDENIPPLLKWIADGEIDGLIDEDCGGFIGYINKAHIERVCKILNERQALLDSHRELLSAMNLVLPMLENRKDADKYLFRLDIFKEAINNAKNI